MIKINKLAFISNAQLSGMKGGAEAFNERMVEHFKKYIPYVEHIAVPCSEDTFEDILKGYITCYDLDLSKFDGVVTTKAPTFAVRHPNHICYLVHTVRVFYDMFDEIKSDLSNHEKRALIHKVDNELLRYPRTKKLFSIGNEVNKRLEEFNNLSSEVIHLGVPSVEYECGEFDYIFMPGRLHKWKRVHLGIEAMKYVNSPIKLKIAGTGEQAEELKRMAAIDDRIEFLGYVTDSEMKELYANALTVIFTPIREDYGLILHEGFKSKKPVIVCCDSGEPTFFIKNGENGFVTEPDPKEIAERIEWLYRNKESAKQMGVNGFNSIANITWDNVVKKIIEALEA